MRNFGFGSQTGIPLPGEARGTVHPVKDWSKVSIAQIPMGHGVAVTPLQMVMAMSAIANNGKLMRPMLVDRLEDDEGRVVVRYQPQPIRQVISETSARDTITALKAVIAVGTGINARLDNYTVAGKTGTAQKIVNGLYSNTRHFSSFIGFFPADNPEVCISVVMDEPKGDDYGGKTAAPVFRNIAERAAHYLNVHPDIEPEMPKQILAVTNSFEEPSGAKPVSEH
jgi:cell division protein FtsI/penicillin-binding protein 2